MHNNGTWYKRWLHLGQFLQQKPSELEIMEYVFSLIEGCGGHHSTKMARYSRDRFKEVVRELNMN